MTPAQVEWSLKLGRCSFPPGTVHKRFARKMAAIAQEDPTRPISEKQAMYLELLVYKYRRQNGWKGETPPSLGRETIGEGAKP